MEEFVSLDERVDRFDSITRKSPIIENHGLLKVIEISNAHRAKIRSSVNHFLWVCLTRYYPAKEFHLSDDMLRDYETDILGFPNITPNGLVLPKTENQLAYNSLQCDVSSAFRELRIDEFIDRIQFPVNLRLQSGKRNSVIDSRPRSSTKPHTDIWAGDPASGILVFLAVLGDCKKVSLRFSRPKNFPLRYVCTLEDYLHGAPVVEDSIGIPAEFSEKGWFLVDPYVIHQTIKAGSGTRLSIDFRFIPNRPVNSDTLEDDTRRPYFINPDKWYDLGQGSLITTRESFKNRGREGRYTIGYPVELEIMALNGKPRSGSIASNPGDGNIVVTSDFVSRKLGISTADINAALKGNLFPKLTYTLLSSEAKDDVIYSILKRMDETELRVVGDNDSTVWEKGWGDILKFIKSSDGFEPRLLRPQYFDHHRIMRFDGNYIDGGGTNFVYEYDQILRRLVFHKYLRNEKNIVELGCGTGTSQLLLSDLCPDAELIASDWAVPSQEIVKEIAKYVGRDIKPVRFNMLTLEGWDQLGITKESAVVTVHALEQLGDKCGLLLDKLVKARPKICVHIEPIIEFYNASNLFDYLAIRYHRKRRYLENWYSQLNALSGAGRVQIIEAKRLYFGDRYHEAYSLAVWKVI